VGVYGYGRNENVSAAHAHLSSAKSLLKTIDENFGTIVFCRRYLERLGVKHYHLGVSPDKSPRKLTGYLLKAVQMRNLMENGIINSYAPLVDVKGSYTAQFEHVRVPHTTTFKANKHFQTILLHSGGKEVISRGDDY